MKEVVSKLDHALNLWAEREEILSEESYDSTNQLR